MKHSGACAKKTPCSTATHLSAAAAAGAILVVPCCIHSANSTIILVRKSQVLDLTTADSVPAYPHNPTNVPQSCEDGRAMLVFLKPGKTRALLIQSCTCFCCMWPISMVSKLRFRFGGFGNTFPMWPMEFAVCAL